MGFIMKIVLLRVFGWSVQSVLCMSRKANIRILTILPFNVPILSTNYLYAVPALDVAVDNINDRYKTTINASVDHLMNTVDSCEDITRNTAQFAAKAYYKSGMPPSTCYALVVSSCVEQSGLASLARELDILLFNLAISSSDFQDTNRGSPTAIAIAASVTGYATVFIRLLAYHKWFHAVVLVEGAPLAQFYWNLADILMEQARLSPLPFDLRRVNQEFVSNDTIKSVLRATSRISRIIVLLTYGSTAAKILHMSEEIGIANGEYVFITVKAFQSESAVMMAQFRPFPEETNLNAYRAFLLLSFDPKSSDRDDLNVDISKAAEASYNITSASKNRPLNVYPVQAAYDTVELLAAVVNKTLSDDSLPGRSCSAAKLAQLIANRTWTLSSGDTFVSSDRVRNPPIHVYNGFNVSLGSLNAVGSYNWITGEMEWDPTKRIDWPTVNGSPSPAVPACGFLGEDGPCAQKRLSIQTAIVVMITFCCVGGFVVYLITRFCSSWFHRLDEDNCLLAADDIRYPKWGKSSTITRASRIYSI